MHRSFLEPSMLDNYKLVSKTLIFDTVLECMVMSQLQGFLNETHLDVWILPKNISQYRMQPLGSIHGYNNVICSQFIYVGCFYIPRHNLK